MSDKTIVVATDLSAPADEALRVAHARAREEAARLLVLHVHTDHVLVSPLFPQQHPVAAEAMARGRAAAMGELEARVGALGEGVETEIVTAEGSAHAEIVRVTEERSAGLLVVGHRGLTGVARMLLGSVAEKVLRYAHCPVMIVRPSPASGVILAGTDFSDPALPAVRAAGVEAKRRSGGKLLLAHAISVTVPWVDGGGPAAAAVLAGPARQELETQTRARLVQALEQSGLEGTPLVLEGAAGAALTTAAEQHHAELLVVGTIGRTGLARLLLGNVAEWVARHAPCSVLVVRLSRP